jgi:tetratricopeptide (TPR) repeat protein
METARRAVEKGQVDKAIREYQRVVQEDPKDVRVWLKIGDLYAKKGAKPEATETYTRVAKFYSDQGFYLKAVAVYKQILKLDPRLVEINLKLAELYRQLGLISDALQHFEMVAAYFHREGKNREALATVRQLVELDSENVATRIKLAELYSKEGMVAEAVTEFGQACDFLRAHNRVDDFIKVAERLLWHKSDNIGLNKELATLYLRRGDPRRALQKLQICFKADGRDVDTLALLAQAFQALEQRGKTVSVLKELARILTESNQRTQAADVHRKILEFVPEDPDSRAFLGVGAPDPSEELIVDDNMLVEEPEIAVQRFTPRPMMGNPTGSFPLVRAEDVPGVNTYDSAEFSGVEIADSDDSDDSDSDTGTDSGLDFQMVQESSSSSYQSSVRGEANSDAIAKILTETDVYIKYGLQQKAVEHLHRIFELDPDSIEARERLKDILVGQGQNHEAVSQLIHLATLFAPANPDRAEGYLREAQQLDPGNPDINDVAVRYRLDLAGEPEVEIVDDPLDFSRDAQPGYGGQSDQGYALGSPPGGDFYPDHPDFGADLGGPTEFAAAPDYNFAAPETLSGEPLPSAYSSSIGGGDSYRLEGSPPPSAFPQPSPPRELSVPGPFGTEGEPAYDFELDLGGDDESMSFDPLPTAEERITAEGASDSGIYTLSDDDIILEDDSAVEGVTVEVSLDQVEAQIALPDEPSQNLNFEQMPINAPPRHLEDIDSTDLRSAEAARKAMFGEESRSGLDPIRGPVALPEDATMDAPLETLGGDATVEGASLEDDLDEVDFFVAQALYPEARDILENLLVRYPNHPLVSAKLEEVLSLETSQPERPMTVDPVPHPEPTLQAKPSVMLEKPVDDEDADTHFDLGLAYKEMGLYEEAIKAFNKVISVAGRAVQCYLMLGLCHREQQNLSEAISQFKAGLYVDSISTAEKYGLYYEIGTCYEQLDDPQEALYYYEMIVKKQPEYRDVAERVDRLRAQRASARP